MTTTTEKREVTIDVAGQGLGRAASQVAHVLLGKDTPSFAKNIVADVRVVVENVDALAIPEKKKDTKIYTRYSGHPGGLRKETLAEVITKKGTNEAFRRAVYNMLPANRLRKNRMKNLIIK